MIDALMMSRALAPVCLTVLAITAATIFIPDLRALLRHLRDDADR